MSKKMCKYWSITTAGGQMCDGAHLPTHRCPKGVNPNTCEIITKKPKAKYKRVKAVFAANRDGEIYSIRWEGYSDKWDKRVWKSCTITIEAKYLKGRK